MRFQPPSRPRGNGPRGLLALALLVIAAAVLALWPDAQRVEIRLASRDGDRVFLHLINHRPAPVWLRGIPGFPYELACADDGPPVIVFDGPRCTVGSRTFTVGVGQSGPFPVSLDGLERRAGFRPRSVGIAYTVHDPWERAQ